jgi:hypothetical protein
LGFEAYRRGGYIKELDARVSFDRDRRRAVMIDLEAAKQILEVDDFPQKEPEVGREYGRWGWDKD